jgi:formylglycine-generating enzyme required for sulfatase activity
MHWLEKMRQLNSARLEFESAQARFDAADQSEKPAHSLTLKTPFYMGKFTVTQEQYQQITGTNPSRVKGPTLPVDSVSWNEAKEFCSKLCNGSVSAQLPTQAEWEFACRAGTTTAYCTGDSDADLKRTAWYSANSLGSMHPVGQKEPNAFGLYDMHGNVWQWCEDWYGARGGSFSSPPGDCRAAYVRDGGIVAAGFRVLVTVN